MRLQTLLFVGLLVVALIAVGFLAFRPQPTPPSSPPIPTPEAVVVTPTIPAAAAVAGASCRQEDLHASLTTEGAAGSVYGTFTIQNVSDRPCVIQGGRFIAVSHDPGVTNLTVTHVGQTQAGAFTLSPQETLYSQIRYQNGPQCHTVGLTQTSVIYTYEISPGQTVTFVNPAGSTAIPTCRDPGDVTQVQVWQLSAKPITPG